MIDNQLKEKRAEGLSICPGIAIGTPFFFFFGDNVIPEFSIAPEKIDKEVKRYRLAVARSRRDILQQKKRMKAQKIEESVQILSAHFQMMEDPQLNEQLEQRIVQEGKNAEYIFSQVIKGFEEQFNQIPDRFFRERFKDLQDISRRIMSHLCDSVSMSRADIPLNSIVFAEDLFPTDTVEAKDSYVRAFVTCYGGETSHAAIIARARGIPYVANVDFPALGLSSQQSVIVDGAAGLVIINPTEESLRYYKEQQKKLLYNRRQIEKSCHLKTETRDSYTLKLSVNIEDVSDIEDMHRYGGAGVGLFRSEYLLGKLEIPSEEEQLTVYREIISAAQGKSVVIRAFDIGGDKFQSLADTKGESNPFLGCRAIRFLLKREDILRTQLRAILRSSAFGDVRLLLPMISRVSEIRKVKEILAQLRKDLESEGHEMSDYLPLGSMIEVPSAAITADILAQESDFLSIGTNDLVQYTLAVDRGNKEMSHLYTPAHPSVIRLIKIIMTEANRYSVSVSVCGEIAADPRYVPLLMGLGVHELSVAPIHLPAIRSAVRATSIIESSKLAEKVLRMKTAEEIQNAIGLHVQALALD